MTATDGYPQNSTINPEGHTPMSTTTATVTRHLNVDMLEMGDIGPTLLPGDTIHIEATLVVRSVTNGLDWQNRPTETVTAKPLGEKPEVVIRVSRLDTIEGTIEWDGETGDGPAEPTKPTRRERFATWKAAHRIEVGIVQGAAWAALWLLAVATLIIGLSGCSVAYHKVGEPCSTVGDTARTKTGSYLVCKAPSASDPTNTLRWRRA